MNGSHEPLPDILRVGRRNRLREREFVRRPMDTHRGLPLPDSALTASVAVHSDIRTVKVFAMPPPANPAAMLAVRQLWALKAADLEVPVTDDIETEHLPAERQIAS
jgi:hypothetical protein